MSAFDHALAFALVIALPVYYLLITPATKRAIEAGEPGRRMRDYRNTLVELWLQGLAVIGLWAYTGRGWWEIGLRRPGGWRFWLLSIAVTAFAVIVVAQVRAVRASEPTRAQLRERLEHLSFMIPRSRPELTVFAALSVSAGVCEEAAYRGFLIWYFLGFLGMPHGWPGSASLMALVLSSLGFGFAHLYLGWRDALRSAITGAFLAGLYLASGSLWLPMALHALLDLNSGCLGWLAFDEGDT